jgi:Putative transposase DNA-binding domain
MHHSRSDALSRRFREYKRRCRATETMLNMLAPPPWLPLVPAISLPSDSSGPPVCKSIRHHLAGHCRVVLVDEYLTSQKCSTCGNQLYLHGRDAECLKCGTTNNRGTKAAKNTGAIFRGHAQGKSRPQTLRRPE